MAVDTNTLAGPRFLLGRFTSAGSAVDVTETLGWAPSLVIIWLCLDATSPNMIVKSAAEADESMLTTGTTGVITTPADTSGITLTSTGFTVVAGVQTNSGVNAWIAFR